jgi:hypothetical protein
MLCMASVKSKYFQYFVIVIIFAIYILFLKFDYEKSKLFLQSQEKDVKLNIQRVKDIEPINNIIFGGSNSLNSLSAEQMSKSAGEKWYNASMNGEMVNVNLYNNFIMDLASDVSSTHISKIVYSSILPYTPKTILSYSNSRYITHRFGIRPNRSVFSYIKNILINGATNSDLHTPESIYGRYGDVDNDDKDCVFRNTTFRYEKVEVSSKYLVERALFLADSFVSAHIYIVLPSVYYGAPTPEFSAFKESLIQKFSDDIFLLAPHLKLRVSLIIQDQYPSNTYICSDGIHAVPLGRTWRTSDLLTRLGVISQTQFENRS